MINLHKHDNFFFDMQIDMLIQNHKPEHILDKLKEYPGFESVFNNEIELRMENHGDY